MGWRDRLRNPFRSEVQQLFNATFDKTGPLTFTSELVTGEYTNKDLWQHRLKVAMEDPIAHRNAVLLAHNVFDDWFVIKKKGTGEEAEELVEHEKNAQIQEEMEGMSAKFHFTQALIGERWNGRSFLVFNYNKHKADVIGEGFQVATMDVFTDENAKLPVEAFGTKVDNPTGVPQWILVYPNAVWTDDTDEIPWEELQMWCTRPKGRSYDGYSANNASWDSMVYNREITDAIAWLVKKLGLGVWLWIMKHPLSQELKDSLEDTFQSMSAKRAIIVERDKVDSVEWSGPPGTGAANSIEILDWLLGLISSATGTPKDVYTGVSAGAITGSEINNKSLFATISKIQSDITPYVLDTIRRMGYEIEGMIIEFNTRYATDELEQAQIEHMQALTRQADADAEQKKLMTSQGRGPMDMSVGIAGPKDPSKKGNPGGLQA